MQTVTLIIDKRKELSTKYKKILENSNNEVLVSKNFISAMKIIQDKEPDLIIISDSVDENISDYCKKIRALTYNLRPVIIATSKSAELADRLAVLDSGADDFISEPVNSQEFVMRIKAHLRRELESNLDSKKFLPGKNYSMRALKRIVSDNKFWAVMLVSIENFKNYKEVYTELASDKLVQTYCAIIRSALLEHDYLGRISDNKFLVITDGFNAEKLANYLTFAFDSVASKFYSPQDIKRGFMIMRGDEFAGKRSNFVHTTIGIVTNEHNKYKDSAALMNSLEEIHKMADSQNKSNYLIERLQISGQICDTKDVQNKILILEDDEAMRILLSTILELQGFEVKQINDVSDIKGNPNIIILDAGEDLKNLKICGQIRQNFSSCKIIVTSVFHDKELILNSGADLYIPKPYEISNLVKWVDELMQQN